MAADTKAGDMKNGWRTLDSAPKSEQVILRVPIAGGFVACPGYLGDFGWCDEVGMLNEPTHWQPFPDTAIE